MDIHMVGIFMGCGAPHRRGGSERHDRENEEDA